MIPIGLQRRDLQPCRVRQGAAAVCPEAEFSAVESGRAHVTTRKSRHRGGRHGWNLEDDPRSDEKAITPTPPFPVFGAFSWKQNPLKTDQHAAV
jgi:hypothetical protein